LYLSHRDHGRGDIMYCIYSVHTWGPKYKKKISKKPPQNQEFIFALKVEIQRAKCKMLITRLQQELNFSQSFLTSQQHVRFKHEKKNPVSGQQGRLRILQSHTL